MSPAPQHGTPAGDAFLAIQQLARRTGGDVQELLTLYALEGLLARIALSRYRDDFVLKGGVLLAAFSLRRPTKDIDIEATRITNDPEKVLDRVHEIVELEAADGLTYNPSAIAAHTIREDDTYSGVRVRLLAALDRARIPIGIDINFGDPIWPAPTEIILPRLINLDREPVHLLGYPIPMVIAEKVVTALERGEANTRWRDFADVHSISCTHTINARDLHTALQTVATHRGIPMQPLLPTLAPMPDIVQAKWETWRRRQSHADTLPEQFADILRAIATLTDPIIDGLLSAGMRWNPHSRAWEQST